MYLGTALVISSLLFGSGDAGAISPAGSVAGFREFYASHARADLPRGAVMELSRRAGPPRISRRDGNTTNAPLTAVGENLLATVDIGGQPFQLLVDTGSSDTWVAAKNFTCVDQDETQKAQAKCNLPTLYTQGPGVQAVPGVKLDLDYDSGEFVVGPMVLETVTMAGITVQQGQVGAVTTASWDGDGTNGGVLGLSMNVSTAAVDANKKPVVYDPLFQKMIQQNLTQPFFSMSIDNVASGPAGFLVFGGLPPVAHNAIFTTVPIVKKNHSSQGPLPSPQVVDYIVPVSSFSVNGNAASTGSLEMFVDSGTLEIVVPDDLATTINDLWDPPAVYNDEDQVLEINCAATGPDVGVTLNGTTFMIRSAAAVVKGVSRCTSGWQGGGSSQDQDSVFLLGDVFMRSVVSVFDLGTSEMHFAART